MAQIVDANGNPISSVKMLTEPQTVNLASLHREFSNHPARGLTPARLARIMNEAEQGNLQAQAELFHDMKERDAHILSEMQKRELGILDLAWKIEPPQNPTAKEKADTDWLIEVATQLPWTPLLLDMMDGVGFGYSNIEITWGLTEKQWLPDKLEHRDPAWFTVAPNDQNKLLLRGEGFGTPLQPFSWISHIHKAKSGYPARCGLVRALVWPYLFKNFSVRDLAELLEILGIPIRLGTYPTGTGKAEKETLLRAVTELGHAAAAIMPEGMGISFHNAATGSQDPFMAMIEWAEGTVSTAVLGGTLSSKSVGATATNALGNVHDGARHELKSSDASKIEPTIGRDLFYPMLALNRGVTDTKRLPRMVFAKSKIEDMAVYSAALPGLVDVGVQIPVNWVGTKLGIPRPAEGEAVLRRAAPPAPVGAGLSASLAATKLPLPPSPVEQMAARLAKDTDQAWAKVFSHIVALVNQAETYEQLQDALLSAYSALPTDDLRAVMAQGFSAAHLAGMVDVQTQIGQ